MPIFKVLIERQYKESEGFTRYIQADTQAEVQALASTLAEQCDNDVPDDCAVIEDSYENDDAYFAPHEIEVVTSVPDDCELLTATDIDPDAADEDEEEEEHDDTPCLDTSFHDHEMDV